MTLISRITLIARKAMLVSLAVSMLVNPVQVMAQSTLDGPTRGLLFPFYGENEDAACGNSVSITLQGNDNIEKTYNFFITKGLAPHQSAGILGNLYVESLGKLDPKVIQNNGRGPGRGIAQWEDKRMHPDASGRWNELEKWASKNGGLDPETLEAQLGFMWYEMEKVSPWDKTLPALKASTDFRQATIAFQDLYEKPGIPHTDRRLQAAKMILDKNGVGIVGEASASICLFGSGDVVAIAKSQVGKKEQPIGCDEGNPSTRGDCGPDVNRYTDNHLEYWCADFVSWVYKEAGKPFTGGSSGGWRIAGVDAVGAWFIKNGTYTQNGPGVTPKPGDVYIIGTPGAPLGTGDHIGIVEKVEGDKLYTISGNTSVDNYRNGVGVGNYPYDDFRNNQHIRGFGSME